MTYTDRLEKKFLIDYALYSKILAFIEPFIEPDRFVGEQGTYLVNSLYFDTVDDKFYWEKLDGERVRKKVRIRSYHDTKTLKPTQTILEIKKKVDSNVFKEKISMPFDDAFNLIKNPHTQSIAAKVSAKEKQAIDDVLYLNYKYDIRPRVMVSYERKAFHDKYNSSTRITFDFNIKYRTADLEIESIDMENYVLAPNLIVMELKYKKFVPIWAVWMIRKFNLSLTTISKYCMAVNKLKHPADF
ncbi:MAG: polyphosphate polymerase domain-containing protein [Candidatus Diapherotrites archaeon]|nr:polyphosphate polymerase domain-containing protein [Candidatus Diapherotrites archaeon]